MKRNFLFVWFLVLCKFFFLGNSVLAQTSDSSRSIDSSKSIIFSGVKNSEESLPPKAKLGAIASLNIGTYHGFRADGFYASFVQPNVGFEFLAEPIGGLHLLFGGHIGISNPLTTGISFGIRQPINISKNPDLQVFGDIGMLFFADEAFATPGTFGARLAFGARTLGKVDMEYRLAGEWRGSGSDSIDGNRSRMLWWVGAEVGIAFSLVPESKEISRKDSLHASLRYIATGDEIDEFDQLTSDVKIDEWLDRFWRVRAINPGSKINEKRVEYEKRVAEANRLFSTPNKLGISTDPGRVMAIYGMPDVEEKDHSLYDDAVHYMLFVYNGRIKDVTFGAFLFRITTTQVYWGQIYSTVPGEMTGSFPYGLPVRMAKWLGL